MVAGVGTPLLIAPRTGVVIANLKAAGEYVIVRAGASVTQLTPGAWVIHAPGKQVLVAGRTLVENAADLPAARALAQQIKVRPLPQSVGGYD